MSWHRIQRKSDDFKQNSNKDKGANIKEVQVIETSDPPIVDDGAAEIILPSDEPFSYLQGLNSDNLMQFSQQSAIQELMLKEQMDIKPNLDVLPTFEEHDIGGYKFQLNIRPQQKGKVNWVYSEALNKVYIRMNDIFSVDAVYTPKMPLQQLRIRAMLCFVKEVSEPVLRCQNHISKDPETHPKLRHSLLRCENPTAEYYGTAEGKSINDRYSIVVPLSQCVAPQKDTPIKQTIALKFTCQNSCIGRRETSLIFLLEGMNGEILSQRIIDVKVCCCPKRDRDIDIRNIDLAKRKMQNTEGFDSRSIIKRRRVSLDDDDDEPPQKSTKVKSERNSSDIGEDSSDANRPKEYDVQRTPSGGFRVVMEMYNKDMMLNMIEYAYNAVAGKIVTERNNVQCYTRHFRKLKRLHEKGQKL